VTIAHARGYICDFCPKKIDTQEDGMIIFGSVCVLGERGLKAKIGEVPVDHNVLQLGRIKTCICWTCFARKVKPVVTPAST
jgi:hypothetical protein